MASPLGPGEVSLIPAEYRYTCQAQGGRVSFGTLQRLPTQLGDLPVM